MVLASTTVPYTCTIPMNGTIWYTCTYHVLKYQWYVYAIQHYLKNDLKYKLSGATGTLCHSQLAS
jgi:hypothetical protein